MRKVLIANRGEISIRVQRACRKLGISFVVVASEIDKGALFTRGAEALYIIGPPPAAQSYLNISNILEAAKSTDCDAIHPGYGFLSERSDFAKAVLDAGLIFIGPDPESIEILGSKTAARARATESGVPVTKGSTSALSDKELEKRAAEIGFPVIVKASFGGGGRGMRVARSASELKDALPRARGEAKKNFGNEDVYIEEYLEAPRHVEVQVFGDSYGNVVHMGTRDCSLQRRHQKLIEEAPAPFLPDSLREEIEKAAVRAAKSVNYKNAGTAEFLVKGDRFCFLEMNTRIQVEHPVTEEVTGIDLVELQLRVARGEKLPFLQEDIKTEGSSIEFRVYAEDPIKNFLPAIGRIEKLKKDLSTPFRDECGVEQGDEISPYYDAMISKVIVTGKTREEAIEKSKKILSGYEIKGLPTTIPFHLWALSQKAFQNGLHDIGFVEREFSKESLHEFEVRSIKDPDYRPPKEGIYFKEHFRYRSEKFGALYTIEVIHSDDGIFIATPIDERGSRARLNRYKRASNGKKTVITSLSTEVLEKFSADEIFS